MFLDDIIVNETYDNGQRILKKLDDQKPALGQSTNYDIEKDRKYKTLYKTNKNMKIV